MSKTGGFFMLLLAVISLAFCQKGLNLPNFLAIFVGDQTYRAIGYIIPEVFTPELDDPAGKGSFLTKRLQQRRSVMQAKQVLYPHAHGAVALHKDSFVWNIVKEKCYLTAVHFPSKAGYLTYFRGEIPLGRPERLRVPVWGESFGFNDKRAFW